MTIYTWPDTRVFVPQTCELRVVDNTQRTAESSLSGYVQTSSMPGARWAWGFDFAPQSSAHRAQLEANQLRLSGRQHRVRLWDLKNPRPRGNIGLSGVTLGVSAVQFATSLVLAGCYPANNAFRYPAAFNNAAWSRVGLAAPTADTEVAPDGTTTAELLVEDGSTGGHYVAQAVPFVAGGIYNVSAHFKAGSGGTRYGNVVLPAAAFGSNKGVVVNLATGAIATNAGGVAANTSAAGGGWWRVDVSAQASSTTSTFVQLRMTASTSFASSYTGDSSSNIGIWGAQCSPGAAVQPYAGVATLEAGDWLALANGQLLRNVEPATADAAGAMTVQVRHMLRAAIASGGAVTLDKPTALFVRTAAGIVFPRQPGDAEPGFSDEFIEVFA